MSNSLVCWFCGHSLAALSLPLSRFDTCKACGVALHACRQCEFYAVGVAKQCREPMAEEEREKERSNACDYFSPYQGPLESKQYLVDTRSELAALFGDDPSVVKDQNQQVNEQIKHKTDTVAESKAALEALFKKKE